MTTTFPLQATMRTIAERTEWAMAQRGLNKNQLEVAADVSPGYLSNMFTRNSDQVKPATVKRLAAALRVNLAWLSGGDGATGDTLLDKALAASASAALVANTAASPAPPPTSDVRITDDATDAIVNDAFNPARHKASDVPPVVEALQRTAALFRDNVDPVAYAARLLDAQAEARTKGRKVSPEELPFAALGMTERLLRLSEEKNAKDTAEARAFIEREGLPALKPGEVHPEIKKAQDRERRRRENR